MEVAGGPDAVVAGLAVRRLGLVAPSDVVTAELSEMAVRHRLRTGRWERQRRGVYAIAGVRGTFEQAAEAARLAHGAEALVTGPAGATLWDMPGRHDTDGIDLLTLTPGKARGPGVVTRRSKVIVPADRARRRSVTVTSWSRTLIENSARRDLSDKQVGWILDDGLRRQLVTLDDLASTAGRLRPARDRSLRRIGLLLEARGVNYDPGASQPEARIAAWLAAAGFGPPEMNATIEADGIRWELDGAYLDRTVCWDYHSTLFHEGPGGITTARKDTRKALVLKRAGWRYSVFDETSTQADVVDTIAHDLRQP